MKEPEERVAITTKIGACMFVVMKGSRMLGLYSRREDAIARAQREGDVIVFDVVATEHVARRDAARSDATAPSDVNS